MNACISPAEKLVAARQCAGCFAKSALHAKMHRGASLLRRARSRFAQKNTLALRAGTQKKRKLTRKSGQPTSHTPAHTATIRAKHKSRSGTKALKARKRLFSTA